MANVSRRVGIYALSALPAPLCILFVSLWCERQSFVYALAGMFEQTSVRSVLPERLVEPERLHELTPVVSFYLCSFLGTWYMNSCIQCSMFGSACVQSRGHTIFEISAVA